MDVVEADAQSDTATHIVSDRLVAIQCSVCAHLQSVIQNALLKVPNLELGRPVKQLCSTTEVIVGDRLELLGFPVFLAEVSEV